MTGGRARNLANQGVHLSAASRLQVTPSAGPIDETG